MSPWFSVATIRGGPFRLAANGDTRVVDDAENDDFRVDRRYELPAPAPGRANRIAAFPSSETETPPGASAAPRTPQSVACWSLRGCVGRDVDDGLCRAQALAQLLVRVTTMPAWSSTDSDNKLSQR